MDAKQVEYLLNLIQERLNELYINTEIGGDDMDDFNNWIGLIKKEMMYYEIIPKMKQD